MLNEAQNANQVSAASDVKGGRPDFEFSLLARVQSDSGSVQSMPEALSPSTVAGQRSSPLTYIRLVSIQHTSLWRNV